MSIEKNFDVSLIAGMALKEKQIQQNYRPIIGVHKWFARRPGTLFRGLLLSEFGNKRLATSGRTATRGDTRCIVLGHLTRMAIWKLHESWDNTQSTAQKITAFAGVLPTLGYPDHVINLVDAVMPEAVSLEPSLSAAKPDEDVRDAVSF